MVKSQSPSKEVGVKSFRVSIKTSIPGQESAAVSLYLEASLLGARRFLLSFYNATNIIPQFNSAEQYWIIPVAYKEFANYAALLSVPGKPYFHFAYWQEACGEAGWNYELFVK